MPEIIKIDPKRPSPSEIERAVEYLRKGQTVAYPTETFYGLGADVGQHQAIKNTYDIKARNYGPPISILVSDLDMMESVVSEVPPKARSLMQRYWPGELTIVLPATSLVPEEFVTDTGKVGIRISSHPVASELVKVFGKPITTLSASPMESPPSLCVRHVQEYFGDKLPCIIDGGEYDPSKGSTVVDIGGDSIRIIRHGAIPAREVIECFQI